MIPWSRPRESESCAQKSVVRSDKGTFFNRVWTRSSIWTPAGEAGAKDRLDVSGDEAWGGLHRKEGPAAVTTRLMAGLAILNARQVDAELVGLVGLAFADALDLWGMQRIDLLASLALALISDPVGQGERPRPRAPFCLICRPIPRI